MTLEFLALSRGRILQLGQDLGEEHGLTDSTTHLSADPILTSEQARLLLDYHRENLSWMHNVVHVQTFQKQCDDFLLAKIIPEKCWLSLYYAMLSVRSFCRFKDLWT